MPEPRGLYTSPEEGSFKSIDQIKFDGLSSPKVSFENPRLLSCSEWFEESRRRKVARESVDTEYNYAKIEVESDRPFYYGLTGDWHLGQNINEDMLERDVEIISDHPLVKGVSFLGDLTDSAFFNPAQNETILNFEEQSEMLMSILDRIPRERIWSFWKGNHDFKWESKGGTSKYSRIREKFGKPIFYGNAFQELFVNDLYSIRFMGSHQLRGSSIYNNAHPVVRAHREVQGLDFAFSGHTHRRGKIEQPTREFNGARNIMGCVVGTYEYSTGYSKDSGWGKMYDPEQGMWWLKVSNSVKDVQILDSDQMLRDSEKYIG